MILMKPKAVLESLTLNAESHIEKSGRTCYQSLPKGQSGYFIRMLVKNGHTSVLEHAYATFRWYCNRGVTHELVRHRAGIGYSQESTRFCNYKGGVMFMVPGEIEIPDMFCGMEVRAYDGHLQQHSDAGGQVHKIGEVAFDWATHMEACEEYYQGCIEAGNKPGFARGGLPIDVKTEIVVTANFRAWRTVLGQRTSMKAHSHIRFLADTTLKKLAYLAPSCFEDLL